MSYDLAAANYYDRLARAAAEAGFGVDDEPPRPAPNLSMRALKWPLFRWGVQRHGNDRPVAS